MSPVVVGYPASCSRRRYTTVAGMTALLSVPTAAVGAQREPYPVDSARIEIAVHPDSSRVQARYWFARPVRALDLTYLSNACTRVGNVEARRDGLPIALVADSTAPWVVLHDTTEAPGQLAAPLRYEIEYRIASSGAGRVSLPLVQPAGALDARGAPVRPKVHIVVRAAGGVDAEPRLPRFTRDGEGEWSTAMSAVPAAVVMHTRSAPAVGGPCRDAVTIPGDHGGFLGTVAAFVATIGLWIPL